MNASGRRAARRLARLHRRALTLHDWETLARPRLPRAIAGYIRNGSDSGATLAHNRAAFSQWHLLPRVLRDVSARSLATELFGHTWAAPFGIAPMGSSAVIAYDGDNRLARAARRAGIPFALTANSVTPMEEVVRHNPGAWYAAYLSDDADRIAELVRRVAATGIDVFAITVDVPVGSNRPADRRLGWSMPIRPRPGVALDAALHPHWLAGAFARTLLRRGVPRISNVEAHARVNIFSRSLGRVTGHAAFTWRQVELVRRLWPGRLVLKGVLAPADARLAREAGVDGIVVSNHGGRQLDMCVSPIDVLPDVKAESGAMAVLADSGFRHGTDILTALALGADFVLVGRPFLLSCVVGGEAGVARAVATLKGELDTDLALLGLTRPAEMDATLLRRR